MRVYRFLQFIFLFLVAADGYSGTKIYEINAPQESPAGDDFIVSIVCSPPDKGNNRAVVIDFPASCSLKAVYAVSPKHPDEVISLGTDTELQSLFQREKGRVTSVYRDECGVFAGEANVIVYYFVFAVTGELSNARFKCGLVERSDPNFRAEPIKDKKGKKKVMTINTNWRLVNPPRGSDFRMSSIPVDYTVDVSIVPDWEENSRALYLHGERSSASLEITNDSLGDVLWNSFSVRFFARTVQPIQDLVTIIRGGDTVRAYIDSYGQTTVQYVSDDGNEQILQSPYLNDGAWHHFVLSKDSMSVWRLFLDGELVDERHFAYLSGSPRSKVIFGSSSRSNEVYIDEFSMLMRAITHADEIRPSIAVALRDTLSDAFAIFHFDEYGITPRSSVYREQTDSASGKTLLRPIAITLDTNAVLVPTSSPVLFEDAVLTVDRPSISKLLFDWRSSSEYDIVAYQLERRIETFSEYQSVLRLPSKKFISASDSEQSPIGRSIYSASENLPKISKDINLYYRLGIVSSDSSIRYTTPIKIEYGEGKDIFLEQNKPNPFNSKTTINYTLKKTSWLNLAIYDILGRQVVKLVDAKTSAGKHTIEIDASDWLPGIYFYKAKIGKQTVTKRMIIIK